jgi:hypothetical protein
MSVRAATVVVGCRESLPGSVASPRSVICLARPFLDDIAGQVGCPIQALNRFARNTAPLSAPRQPSVHRLGCLLVIGKRAGMH